MGWKEQAEAYWKSISEDKKKRHWLGSHVTWDADDVTTMTADQIRENFPYRESSPGVNDSQLARTLIWQSWNKIRSGEMQPIKGNLRSFWYREYEPFYVKLGMLSNHWEEPEEPEAAAERNSLPPPAKWVALMSEMATLSNFSMLDDEKRHALQWFNSKSGRPTYLLNLMTQSFDQFVINRIFHFQDEFQFEDPRRNFRRIGKLRARILLCTEKEGLYPLVSGFAAKNGISAMASHGESHWLSMSYMADDLEKNGVARVLLGALTDYDPFGYTIAENFAEKLTVFGFKVDLTHLTTPDLFTPAQLVRGKRDFAGMDKGRQTQIDKWFKKTKGINGERAGIHLDLADWPAIEKVADKWLKSLKK